MIDTDVRCAATIKSTRKKAASSISITLFERMLVKYVVFGNYLV